MLGRVALPEDLFTQHVSSRPILSLRLAFEPYPSDSSRRWNTTIPNYCLAVHKDFGGPFDHTLQSH